MRQHCSATLSMKLEQLTGSKGNVSYSKLSVATRKTVSPRYNV